MACPIESTRNITAGIGFILGAVSVAWLGVRQRKGAQKEYEDTVRRYTGTTMMKVVWIEESVNERWEQQEDGSEHYGKHVAVELTEDNHIQFFIPKGFAHGFAVLSETAVFQYKCDNFYHPEADGGISILDDTLGIDWKIPTEHANLSEKDTKHSMLKGFDSPFDVSVDLYI